MEALILSCGTGGGHNSAGKAVMEELKAQSHRAVMLNPYSLQSNRLSSAIDKTYISTVRSAPKVFGAVYKLGDLYRKLPVHSPVYFANHAMTAAMAEYLEQNHFDIIIMSHLFPAEILTNMKQHGISIPKTMYIATDYVCIPFTEETACDAYVIPAPDLADHFAQTGIPRKKLHPLGIPIASSFTQSLTREQARQQLGLELDKKYILISGGSMGGGKLEQTIRALQGHLSGGNAHLIVICGSNTVLYEKLKTLYCANEMTVIGHTNYMAAYLKAADLFITKPGGLSSTEAAVCGVPLLHTTPIPGCESYNARYFSQRGMSVFCQSDEDTASAALRLLKDSPSARYMADCQNQYIEKEAAKKICSLAESMAAQ